MAIVKKITNFTREDVYSKPYLPAVLVFAALMVIIFVSWRTARQDITNQQNNVVNENATFIENTVVQRFSIYENTLRAGNGLFLSSDFVSRDEWRVFVNSLNLEKRYPGIRSVGYATYVPASQKQTYIDTITAERIDGFAITPAADKAAYAPITYVYLTAGQNVSDRSAATLGFDMFSDPVRKKAMDQAVDTGQPTLTSTVTLQAINAKLPGFLMFVPIYAKQQPVNTVEERRAAVSGFLYAPFANAGVFASLFTVHDPNFGFAIYNGAITNDNLIYQSAADLNQPYFTRFKQSSVNVYGQKWTFVYSAKSAIVPYSVRSRPFGVLVGGGIFAAALALIIYLLIQRRTRALTYNEQRKLEAAKDDLLSLASHQLRTPATAVKQYVSMVKEGFAGDVTREQQKLLQMAYDSNERQLTIVDDLLYVARIDAGKAVLKLEKTDITALLESVIADQKGATKARRQTVRLKKPGKAVHADADAHYLRMVFENLLSNASKYSYEGKTIQISLKRSPKYIQVDFADNGVGIEPKDYGNVFLKFSRIPNELTRQIAGSGIGLYLAKQLMLLHGGDITFTSVGGKGSTFSVTLPPKNTHASE